MMRKLTEGVSVVAVAIVSVVAFADAAQERLDELDPGLKQIGLLSTCDAKDLKSSPWSIGCETPVRDCAMRETMKWRVGKSGAKHWRIFACRSKAETKKGAYDFACLDAPVREMAAAGVKPWICLSCGGLEDLQAWIGYVEACVRRYKDVVDEWEVRNEPSGRGLDYAELFYRTAKAIRAVQPEAKIYCTAIDFPKGYTCVLEKLKKENALDLGSRFIFRPQDGNPDSEWRTCVEPMRKLVKGYSGSFDVMQGAAECAGPDGLAQAKCLLRRAVGGAARAIPSCFTLPDEGDGAAFDALRNVFCFLTDEAHPVSVADGDAWFRLESRFDPRDTSKRKLSAARFSRFGSQVRFFWYSDARPSDALGFDRVTVWLQAGTIRRPVWVDMVTGRVFEIPEKDIRREKDRLYLTVPMWDSPVMIASRGAVPLRYDWKNETPYAIIDSIYRPGQLGNRMKGLPPDGTEPWMSMKTDEFLPCFDKYGQFKYRDWPGKTKDDAELKRAAEEEAKDLAANPGPKDRDRYGGWAAGPQLEATGRFRTEKVDGKWWFVDPEGRLFWSFGVMRVSASCGMTPMNGDTGTPHRGMPIADRDCLFAELPPPPDAPDATPFSKFWTTRDELLMPYYEARNETRIYDFSSANLYRKYGADYYAKFADIVHRRVRSWCMNTLSSSSDIPICLMDRTPYVERIERKSRPIEASYGYWFKFPDPWDPSFRTGILAGLEKRKAQAKDPWCIGFFVDNEIDWGASPSKLAEWTMQSPADQPAKKALVEFMRGKYGDVAKLNAAWGAKYTDWSDILHTVFLPGPKASGDLAAFSREIEEGYFRGVRAAVKEFEPKLLYLGCRFSGNPRRSVVEACARYADVVSFNIYQPSPKPRLTAIAGLDKPVLIPEFHIGANDRGSFGTGVCSAKSTAERAEMAKRYVRDALSIPNVVGCHWHQFSDEATSGRFDGEYLTVGFTDICDTPYPEMVKALREAGGGIYETRFGRRESRPYKALEIATAGYLAFGQPTGNYYEAIVKHSGLQAIHADGAVTLRLKEEGRDRREEEGSTVETIRLKDEYYPFEVVRHVRSWKDCAAVETWAEIRHSEPGPVRLVRADSFAAPVNVESDVVRVLTLTGQGNNEANVSDAEVVRGQYVQYLSCAGTRDAWESNPAMMVSFGKDVDEERGRVLGVALEWTGTSCKRVRRNWDGKRLEVFAGIDMTSGPYTLDPGVTFTTPRAILVWSESGRGEVSRQYHRWAHRHLMPHGYDLHAVLLNSWEGSYFSFTEQTLLDMMDGVKEMGGEMFVLDDGWFGKGKYARDDVNKATAGLGDWCVNTEKLPRGLGFLADEAGKRGLKFGIWVEPEMANTNSWLIQRHPEWMLQERGRPVVVGRGKSQVVLDFANPAVRDDMFRQIDETYSTMPTLAFVKWDCNANIHNPGSTYIPADRQPNLWYDYTIGYYELLARFQKKRPDVMVQACASGGGHMDFGSLRYADEFWASDRTDPYSRIFIQWGASQFYPASAMACHVTASPNHQTKRKTPLKYRFDVAMTGRLGFELHPKDLKPEEVAFAKAAVADYKRIRPVVQRGDLYRLVSPYEKPLSAVMYASEDKDAAAVFALGLKIEGERVETLKLRGLDPDARYSIREIDCGARLHANLPAAGATGRELAENGVAVALSGDYDSAVFEIRRADVSAGR